MGVIISLFLFFFKFHKICDVISYLKKNKKKRISIKKKIQFKIKRKSSNQTRIYMLYINNDYIKTILIFFFYFFSYLHPFLLDKRHALGSS